MELKGSRTEANLKEAFAGESQARNKYTYFASAAKKEGFEQIASVFLETAEQEREHAKLHLQALSGIGNTVANLKGAAAGEGEEWTQMYPRMAREAREAEQTLTRRRTALAANDLAFSCGADLLSALFWAAGEGDLADRVRPSKRRPGRVAEEEPAAPTPPADASKDG